MLLSGRRRGACAALRWQEAPQQYRCGALVTADDVLRSALPRFLNRLAPLLAPLLRRLARRWIAAGLGCDSSLELAALPADPETDRQSPA